MKRSKLFKPFLYQLLKPFSFWFLVLYIISDFLFYHNLNKLPYNFLSDTSGPARLPGDYAKKEVIPKDCFALVSDSNVYGFGPWLYDNSCSMGQPNFATHHLLQTHNHNAVAFGYPRFGNMGSSSTAVAEVTTRLDLEFIDTTDYLNLRAAEASCKGQERPYPPKPQGI